ncbi:MAG: L,D-transpeptidase family protein [Acidimicrobiales bacterium]
MARGRHIRRNPMRVAVIVGAAALIVVLALGGMAFAAYRYEQAQADRILPGVTISGVQVGGMTRDEAIAAVQEEASGRLGAPIQVSLDGRTWTVTPQELGRHTDVTRAVDSAFRFDDSVGLVSRFWHRFRHQPMNTDIALRYSGADGVTAFVDKVSKAVTHAPVEAALTTDGTTLIVVKPKAGRTLDEKAAAVQLRSALATQATTVDLSLQRVAPTVTAHTLGVTVVVRVDQNRLDLYKGFRIERTFPVATAKPPWVTPSGDWIVERKAENPTWYNPAPNGWAAADPLVVPGGPGNPMGSRALYLSAPGLIRIHGTSDSERPSIGHYESHGCIRMLNEDVEQLYPLVPVGTHVLIVGHRPY